MSSNFNLSPIERARKLQELQGKYSKVFNEIDPKRGEEAEQVSEVSNRAVNNITQGADPNFSPDVKRILEFIQDFPARLDAIINGFDNNPFPAEQKINMTKDSLKKMRDSVKSFYSQVTKTNPWG